MKTYKKKNKEKKASSLSVHIKKNIFEGFSLGLEVDSTPKTINTRAVWVRFNFGFHSLVFHYIRNKR